MQDAWHWVKRNAYWFRLGGLLLCALIIGREALFLRERAVRRLPLDHDERIYLYAARYYARSFQKGDLGRMLDSDITYEHPSFVKLVYGIALYVRHQDLPAFEKEGFIIGERLLGEHPAKPLLITARKVSAWAGTLAAMLLALTNPLAGLFLAVHSFAVKYTSVAYLEAIPMLTSLLAICSFQSWHDRINQRSFRRDWIWLALSAALLGLSAASKYIYAGVGFAILGYGLGVMLYSSLKNRRTDTPRRVSIPHRLYDEPAKYLLALAAWGALALLFFLAADIYLWHDPIDRLMKSIAFSLDFSQNEYVKSMNYPFWQPLYWLSRPVVQHDAWVIPHLPGDILITIDTWIGLLALIGLPRLVKKRPLAAWWLGIGFAFLFLWNTKWPQYVLIVLAPLCLAAAEGVHTLLLSIYHLFHLSVTGLRSRSFKPRLPASISRRIACLPKTCSLL